VGAKALAELAEFSAFVWLTEAEESVLCYCRRLWGC